MRHGDANITRPDRDRALSTSGAIQVRLSAASLLKTGKPISQLIASPLRRAQETASLMANLTGYNDELMTWDELARNGDLDLVIIGLLRSGYSNPLLVTHQPFVSRFIQRLTGELVMMDTASIVSITLDPHRPESSKLEWLIQARR